METLNAGQIEQGQAALAPGEVAAVCARYNLGPIKRVFGFAKGSSVSPKAVIDTDSGRYLIKRRAKGRDDPYQVACTHDIQLFLSARGFPTPSLVGTHHGANSMVQLDGRVYEVFGFVEGEGFDRTPGPCEDAGRILADLHRHLAEFRPRWPAAVWTASHLGAIERQIQSIRERRIERGTARGLADLVRVARARLAGSRRWPVQMVHADWHPGNLIFRQGRVVAVLDFDGARQAPVLLDLASGLMQFSMTRVGPDPEAWPEALDAHRFASFVRGYGPAALGPVENPWSRAIGPLMAALLVGEVVAPVAATGMFASQAPGPFLRMAKRKGTWLLENADRLRVLAERSARAA